jgi:hypothetical protein
VTPSHVALSTSKRFDSAVAAKVLWCSIVVHHLPFDRSGDKRDVSDVDGSAPCADTTRVSRSIRGRKDNRDEAIQTQVSLGSAKETT